jgi:hypothetical protein
LILVNYSLIVDVRDAPRTKASPDFVRISAYG